MLVLFYYLSQNPDFAESVKPLMNQIKDSEQMLKFLNDLSKFSQTFSTFQTTPKEEKSGCAPPPTHNPQSKESTQEKKTPQSPTVGIADDFIQTILDSYLKGCVKENG